MFTDHLTVLFQQKHTFYLEVLKRTDHHAIHLIPKKDRYSTEARKLGTIQNIYDIIERSSFQSIPKERGFMKRSYLPLSNKFGPMTLGRSKGFFGQLNMNPPKSSRPVTSRRVAPRMVISFIETNVEIIFNFFSVMRIKGLLVDLLYPASLAPANCV